MTNTRLATIATRQRSSRARDVMFALLVTLAAVVSVSSVAQAADASMPATALTVAH
jgi:hypothetical protein